MTFETDLRLKLKNMKFSYIDVNCNSCQFLEVDERVNESQMDPEEIFDEFSIDKLQSLTKWFKMQKNPSDIMIITNSQLAQNYIEGKLKETTYRHEISVSSDFTLSCEASLSSLISIEGFQLKTQEISNSDDIIDSNDKRDDLISQLSPIQASPVKSIRHKIMVHFSLPLDVNSSNDTKIKARKKETAQIKVDIKKLYKRIVYSADTSCHVFLIPNASQKHFKDLVSSLSFLNYECFDNSDSLQVKYNTFEIAEHKQDVAAFHLERLGLYDSEDLELMKSFTKKLKNLRLDQDEIINTKIREIGNKDKDSDINPFI